MLQSCSLARKEPSMTRPSAADKRRTFRKLHESGCFVIPNPWNVGSARYLQGLGFKALATTSSGFAHAQGYPDGAVPREVVLAHLREIADATDVPVNADFEGGYADEPEGVAESVRLAVATGVAGLSIEDFTDDDANPLYDFDLALARVRAARAAIDKAGGDVVFTARSEGFIKGRPNLDETIRRLKAFADAGADCGEFSHVGGDRIQRERPRRARRAPHQPRRHARARRLDRRCSCGARDRERGQFRRSCRHH